MNINVLLYLCKNNEIELLEEVLSENKNNLNYKVTVTKEIIEKNIKKENMENWYTNEREFDSLIDCLMWFAIANNNRVALDFLLKLDFFDYKLIKNSFFIAACKDNVELLDKMIKLGFDYMSTDCKYGKNRDKDCSCLDSAITGCICRQSEKAINYLISIPNVTIYDFKLSIISIVAYKREDILKKFIDNEKDGLEYLNSLTEMGRIRESAENYIKSIYSI